MKIIVTSSLLSLGILFSSTVFAEDSLGIGSDPRGIMQDGTTDQQQTGPYNPNAKESDSVPTPNGVGSSINSSPSRMGSDAIIPSAPQGRKIHY